MLARLCLTLVIGRFGYLFERFPAFTQTFCARELVEHYRQGFEPDVFSLRRPIDRMPPELNVDRIPVYYLPDTNSLEFKLHTKFVSGKTKKIWSGKGDRRDKVRFREAVFLGPRMRRSGITHIHVHFAGLAARTAWWIKRLFGISYSITAHANDIFCPKLDQRIELGALISEAALLITVSDFSATLLRERFPEAARKIFRVYNGLDLTHFSPGTPVLNPLRILSIGRLIEKKGFPILVEACGQLQRKGIPFECRIVGEGAQRETLERSIQDRQLSNQVLLLGAKTQSEITGLLERSSVFVLAAVRDRNGDMDNLPTVLIEAMATGLPLIGSAIAGIPEIIFDGVNGFTVPENDPSSLGKAIETFAASPSLLESFGRQSRQIAESKFSINETTAQLRQLFTEFGSFSAKQGDPEKSPS